MSQNNSTDPNRLPPLFILIALAVTAFLLWPKVQPYLSDDPASVQAALSPDRSTSSALGAQPPTSSEPLPVNTTWRTLQHFKGASIRTTQKFKVEATEWRIRWEAKGDARGIFQVYAYGDDGMPQVAANNPGPGKDISFIYEAGNFYLTINTDEPYDVWVESPE